MKRILVLLCAVAILSMILCSCMSTTAGKVKDAASEAVSDMKQSATAYSGDNEGLFDDNRSTELPTEKSNMMETIADAVATELDDMVENGEVEDGDGNVGERENKDGDGNVDANAAD